MNRSIITVCTSHNYHKLCADIVFCCSRLNMAAADAHPLRCHSFALRSCWVCRPCYDQGLGHHSHLDTHHVEVMRFQVECPRTEHSEFRMRRLLCSHCQGQMTLNTWHWMCRNGCCFRDCTIRVSSSGRGTSKRRRLNPGPSGGLDDATSG